MPPFALCYCLVGTGKIGYYEQSMTAFHADYPILNWKVFFTPFKGMCAGGLTLSILYYGQCWLRKWSYSTPGQTETPEWNKISFTDCATCKEPLGTPIRPRFIIRFIIISLHDVAAWWNYTVYKTFSYIFYFLGMLARSTAWARDAFLGLSSTYLNPLKS